MRAKDMSASFAPRVSPPISNEVRMEALIWIYPIKSLDFLFVPFMHSEGQVCG